MVLYMFIAFVIGVELSLAWRTHRKLKARLREGDAMKDTLITGLNDLLDPKELDELKKRERADAVAHRHHLRQRRP